MTILDLFQRRKSRESLLKNRGIKATRMHRDNYSVRTKRTKRTRMQSGDPPEIGPATEKAMKGEVMDLVGCAAGYCTVLAMANALVGSASVLTLHAKEHQRSVDSIRFQFSGFSFKSRTRSAELGALSKLASRYNLIDALNMLERRPESSEQRVHSWEEAKQILSTIVRFPTEKKEPLKLEMEEVRRGKADSVQTYVNRRRAEIMREIEHFAKPSDQKWRQISLTPKRTRLSGEKGKDRDVSAGKLKEDGSDYDSIPSTENIRDVDEPLALRLDKEYEKRELRKQNSKTLLEVEQRRLEKLAIIEQQKRQDEAKKRASSLMRPLGEEERDLVKQAMYGTGPLDTIICEVGTDFVQRGSMHTLQPGKWLNDEVIHYFYVMLSKRDEEMCRNNPSRKRSHFFKSFFMTKLLNEGNADPSLDGKYEYRNVRRWSKKVPGKDIFKLDKIIFPINQRQMHWLCAVAFMTEKRVQVYDSMGSGSEDIYYAEHIFQYIQDEHKDKKGSPLPDAEKWKVVPCSEDTPQQKNGFDCGVFTCMFADFLSKDCPLLFSQEHLTQCRERIALSIMNGSAII